MTMEYKLVHVYHEFSDEEEETGKRARYHHTELVNLSTGAVGIFTDSFEATDIAEKLNGSLTKSENRYELQAAA